MKKSKKSKYTKKLADQLFSLIIRKAGKCFRCRSIFHLQTAHIVTRWYLPTRWSLDIALCLCAKCHLFFTYRPLEWEEYIVGQFGREHWDDLKLRARTYVKIDYQEVIEHLHSLVNTEVSARIINS